MSAVLKKNLKVSLYTAKNILKTKIKSYDGKANTIFHNDKTPKEGSYCICLSVVLIDSVFKKCKN